MVCGLFAGGKRIRTPGPANLVRSEWLPPPHQPRFDGHAGSWVRTRLLAGERWIRSIGSPSELNIRTEPGDGEARIQLTAGNRMHWQKGGCELCSPVKVATSAETASHVRFRSPANRPCRSYSSGICVEVRLFLENHTIVAANARTRIDRLVRSQADQAASSRVHSASLVQPARIRYWASSADISIVPSGLTLMCRPEKVCTDPIPEGACRRTRYRSGFSGF